MKQKDYILIVVTVIFSGFFSIVISSLLVGSADVTQQEAEVVQPLTADFNEPPKKYFNDQSVNPTQLILIDDNANQTPFSE